MQATEFRLLYASDESAEGGRYVVVFAATMGADEAADIIAATDSADPVGGPVQAALRAAVADGRLVLPA